MRNYLLRKNYLLFLSFLVFFAISLKSWGQIATLAISSTQTGNTTGAATFTSDNANLTSEPAVTLTAGQQGQAGGAYFISSQNWSESTINTSQYYQFTLTANPNYLISVTSIAIELYRSASGPATVTLRSSADGYVSDLGGGPYSLASASYVTETFSSLSLSGLSSVTFRLYGYGASGTGTLRIGNTTSGSNAIQVNGSLTACTAPGSQASGVSFTNVYYNGMTINWTPQGTSSAVFVSTSAGATAPTNGTTYTASSNWNNGSPTGTALGSGYCVYSGSGSSVTLTNMSLNTTYYVYVYAYNCNSTYNTSTTGNSGSQLTPSGGITTGSVSTLPFCVNASNTASGTVAYTSVGTFSGATFTAYLSDQNGNFGSPTNIGTATVTGTNPSGTINITIPDGLTTSSNYLIQIDCNSPSITGSNSSAFNIVNTDGNNVTGATATLGYETCVLNWTNPAAGCWTNIMIVASTSSSITGQPSGSYTNSSSSFTDGGNSTFGGGVVVYVGGTGTSTATVTGLTYGTQYYFEIYTGNNTGGGAWSTGTAVQPASGNILGYYWSGNSGAWSATNWQVNNTGSEVVWSDNHNAVFTGTAGNVTLDATRTATNNYFLQNGYTLSTSSGTAETLSGPIVLGSGVGLTLAPDNSGGTAGTITLSGTGVSSPDNTGSLTIQGATSGSFNQYTGQTIALNTAGQTISVSTTIVGSLGCAGYTCKATGTVNITGNITNNSAGTWTMLGGSGAGNIINVTGVISGSEPVSYGSTGGGGAATLILGGNNTYTGGFYFDGGATSGLVQLGNNNGLGATGYPVTFMNTGGGGSLDLHGYSPSIGTINDVTGGTTTTVIENLATNTPSTLTYNQTTTTSLPLGIENGAGTSTIALVQNGTGSLTLSGTSTLYTYTGGLTINGGSLFYNPTGTAGTDIISAGPPVTLNGGTLGTTNIASSTGITTLNFGTLAVGSSNGTITLGTNVHTIKFANSNSSLSGPAWSGTLTINNWTGTSSGGSVGRIYVGTDNTGLSAGQLANIQFTNFPLGASITAFGELTPTSFVPQLSCTSLTPSSYITTLSNVSATGTFTVTGYLLGSTVTVSATGGGYEFSTDNFGAGDPNGYSSLTLTGPTISQIVYVRMTGASAGIFDGPITVVDNDMSDGVSTQDVTVSGQVYSGQFASGDLAVEVLGDGSTALSGVATQINVWEFNTSGSIQNQFKYPESGSLPNSAPYNITESGTAATGGALNRSSDGSLITVAGYNATLGTSGITSSLSATNERVIGTINQGGTMTTADAFNLYNANNFRSVVSNGFSYWMAGTITGGIGIYFLQNENSTPLSMGASNTELLNIYNGNLYYSSQKGNHGIFQLGTNGLPVDITNTAVTQLTDANYATGGDPLGFSINPAGTIMYIADDGAFTSSITESSTANSNGGIVKYTNSGSGWTYAYTMRVLSTTTNGASGIEVDWTQNPPVIYCTTNYEGSNIIPNDLVVITDNGSSSTGTSISNSGSKYVYRGVKFAPIATPTAIYSTATAFNFLAEPPNGVSNSPFVFNACGTGFTGNLTVTAPTGYQVSLDGISYGSSVNAGTSPANTTIYIVFAPTTTGNYNSVMGTPSTYVRLQATGVTEVDVPVSGQCINPVNYYNVANTDLTNPMNWGTNTDGSGTNPPDFVTDGQYFNLYNSYNALNTAATTAYILPAGDGSSVGGSTTSGSNQIIWLTGDAYCATSPSSFVVGATITDPVGGSIPSGTTITNIDGNIITMSQNATGTTNYGNFEITGITGPWTIGGTLSKLIVTNNQTFTIPSDYAYSGTMDVTNGATAVLQNTSIPTFGTLGASSTVEYNQTGHTVVLPYNNQPASSTISSITYGNLSIQGSNPTTDIFDLPNAGNISNVTTFNVAGNLYVDNATVVSYATAPYTYISLGGNLTVGADGAVFGASPVTAANILPNIFTSGNGNQTISYTGGGTINLGTFESTKSAGTLTLGTNTELLVQNSITIHTGVILTYSGTAAFTSQSGSSLNTTNTANINLNFTGSSTFSLGGNINTADNTSANYTVSVTEASSLYCNFATGTSFTDNGNDIKVSSNLGMAGVAGAYNLTGTVTVATATGSSLIESDNTSNGAIVAALNNFDFNPTAGTSTVFEPSTGSGNIIINGNFTIESSAATTNKIGAQGNTIEIGGNFDDLSSSNMMSNGTSTYEFNSGTGTQSISSNYASFSFYNLEINNTAANVTLGSNLKVTNILTLTDGLLDIGNYSLTMGNSGSVSGGSNSSFVYTSGTGSMIAQVGNTDVLFPVGYTDYNPVTLNNSSTAANFDVSVSNTISHNPTTPSKVVDKQWNISGTGNCIVELGWNTGDQAVSFNPLGDVLIGEWNGSSAYNTYVSSVGGSYNATATGITTFGQPFIAGNVNAFGTSTLTLNTSTLSAADYAEGDGPSATLTSFTVYGTNLTGYPNYLSVTGAGGAALTDFQVSTDGTNWYSRIQTSDANANLAFTTPDFASSVSPQTIYVRLAAGLLTNPSYTETVYINGGGATQQTVACSGAVTAGVCSVNPSVISTGTTITPTATGATISGSTWGVAGTYCDITDEGICWSTTTGGEVAGTNATSAVSSTSPFSTTLSILSVNTQYYVKAYATNGHGTALDDQSTEQNFWTLANPPTNAPTVNNATINSLDVAINNTYTADGNPSGTLYAIKETTTGHYVQSSNGALGAAVWQTTTAWAGDGTITVTGLASTTAYHFEVIAENGADVAAVGPTASGTTLTPGPVTYTWTGGASGSWVVASNWSTSPNTPGTTPGNATTDNVVIESGTVSITAVPTTTIDAMTLTGTVSLTDGAVAMTSITAGSTVNLTLTPSATFTLPAINLNNFTFAGDVSLSGAMQITGVVTPTSGTLSSNGNLTLLSTASNTALISGTGSGNVTGKVYEQRYLSGANGYHLIGSAFSNATYNQLPLLGTFVSNQPYTLTGTVSDVWLYNETITTGNAPTGYSMDNGWYSPASVSGTIALLDGCPLGFAAYMSGETFTMSGTVNNGDITVSGLTYTNHTEGLNDDGWQLISNPYPSPIDWTQLELTNMSTSFSVGQPTANGQVWATCTQSDVTANGGSKNIPSLQSFFVKVASGGNGTVAFTNSVRVDQNPTFYKKDDATDKTLLRLQLSSQNTNYVADETVIYFDDNATMNFDNNYDAAKMFNSGNVLNLYSSLNKALYTINCIPSNFTDELIIPLGYMVPSAGSYSINASEVVNFAAGWNIYLVDNETGNVQDLNANPMYSFNISQNELNSAVRLYVKFTNATATGITANNQQSAVNIFTYNNVLTVTGKVAGADVFVYDLTGKLIAQPVKVNNNVYKADLSYLAAGCYLVKVINDNSTVVKKIVVSN